MSYFISEISSNHGNDLERCEEFIKVSKEIGCDAVKFQLFEIEKLFSPEAIKFMPELLLRKKWELNKELIPKLARICHEQQIDFGCTPFALEFVDLLKPWVNFFKIASYELLWDDLLKKCAETGKPVIVSTGMATLEEVIHAVDVLKRYNAKSITVLHCTSSYPTPLHQANLNNILTLRTELGVDIGYSDHTVSTSVLAGACLHYDSKVIEFHLDLDGKGAEYDKGHCWLPHQIQSVISIIKDFPKAKGQFEKKPSDLELDERNWRADPSDGLRPLMHKRMEIS